MSTPDTRTSDVDELLINFVKASEEIREQHDWPNNVTHLQKQWLRKALTSFREKVVAEEREQIKKTAFNIRHCAKIIVASLGDPIRTQIELEHLKAHIKALTPPKETN